MKEKLSLKQWQRQFKEAVRGTLPNSQIETLGVVSSPTFLPYQRLKVYKYAYKARMIESLEDDFSQLRERVGANKFRLIAEDYLLTHPSHFSSLAEFSKDFPSFLQEQGERYDLAEPLVYLAEREWSKLKLSLQPTPAEVNFRTEDLVKDPEAFVLRRTPLMARQQVKGRCYLLWRRGLKVEERILTKSEGLILDLLGKPMSPAALADELGRQDLTATTVEKGIARLVGEGVIQILRREDA